MLVQVVQTAAHCQVEQAELISADQIEMSAIPMLVELVTQFPERKPLQIQRENAVPGERDAALLFIFDRLARSTHMTVHVQDCRNFAVKVERLVENRSRLEPRNDLVPQLA